MKSDRHVHTPYCPHGSKDSFNQYIERAIELGFSQLTFTEHAPLPKGFEDPVPAKDSAMAWDSLEHYLHDLAQLKKEYKREISILSGLEVDYIVGFENQTTDLLNQIGDQLDDTILSVHFLQKDRAYYCLDYSPNHFGEMTSIFGSTEEVYQLYYETVLNSIQADLGCFKPKRIGHMTLVHKFQQAYPCNQSFKPILNQILDHIKVKGYQLDFNSAGLRKEYCQEVYPTNWVVAEAKKRKIPLIFGSDAHSSKEVGFKYTDLYDMIKSEQSN